MTAVLEARSLNLDLRSAGHFQPILRGLSLTVARGEIVGLVGESGSGKSVTGLAAMGLLPRPRFAVRDGSMRVFGQDVWGMSERELRRLRGRRIAMVFQEPMNALNPSMRVGVQLTGAMRANGVESDASARDRAGGLLERMLVADPGRVLDAYPHQLSGGLRQRVLLAMALSADIELLIADEPTTALDVTVQAKVLTMIRERARAQHLGVLFITHDLGVVSQVCDRVYVMYAGAVVEAGSANEVLDLPLHPYSRALRASLPGTGPAKSPLAVIPGCVPAAAEVAGGCAFVPRCGYATPHCETLTPRMAGPDEHLSACWRAEHGPW